MMGFPLGPMAVRLNLYVCVAGGLAVTLRSFCQLRTGVHEIILYNRVPTLLWHVVGILVALVFCVADVCCVLVRAAG